MLFGVYRMDTVREKELLCQFLNLVADSRRLPCRWRHVEQFRKYLIKFSMLQLWFQDYLFHHLVQYDAIGAHQQHSQ